MFLGVWLGRLEGIVRDVRFLHGYFAGRWCRPWCESRESDIAEWNILRMVAKGDANNDQQS
jgi:hypothetical protein